MFSMYKIIKAMNKQAGKQLGAIFVKQEQGALNKIILQKIFSKIREVLFHTVRNLIVELIATGCCGGQRYKWIPKVI